MRCTNCGAELAPEHLFCETCGAGRPPFAQRLAESEREFAALRARRQAGELSETDFNAELKRLIVYDEGAGYWMLGAQTGRWYWFDGQQWVVRDLPVAPAPGPLGGQQTLATRPLATASAPRPAEGRVQATRVDSASVAAPSSFESALPRASADVGADDTTVRRLQRMLFVAAAGTFGALLGVLLAYVAGFVCRSGGLACSLAQFACIGIGLGLALGLGCGVLLGADARGTALGIPLGALGGLTGGVLLLAVRLTLLPPGQAAEGNPTLLGQVLPPLLFCLALALMIGLLPGLLTRSSSRAIAGVLWVVAGALVVVVLMAIIQGAGLASLQEGLWAGETLGSAGVPGRLAATAWPGLLMGSLLGAALGLGSVPD